MIPIDENFICNLNLKSDLAQFIQSGQVYNSTYAIYGKFSKNNGNISEIELSVINYKGILELEFNEDFNITCELNSFSEEKVHLITITLELRASVSGKTTPLKTIKPSSSMDQFKDIPQDEAVFLVVERKLAPIWGSETENPFCNGVFDSEFFYRDGNRYLPRAIKTIPDTAYSSNLRVVNPDSPLEKMGFKPGFKCRNSTLYVLR
ncbi:MAG: hypothetical protein R2781_10910 [Flavobacteriaceae bacterium]